jgi:Domain of unknown function (DUF4920)
MSAPSRKSGRTLTLLLALGTAAGISGCSRRPTHAPAPAQPTEVKPSPAGEARKVYGAPLAAAEPIALATLLANPEPYRNQTVTIEGDVRKACTRKGCWMELAESTKDGAQGCRITFKDYGFFVPTDSAGARARVQGTVEVDTLSAAAVRHYEEEGAVFAGKRPDGTAPEVRLVASGVELWRSGKPDPN